MFGNGDPKQLRPPSGPLMWISPILFTNFTFHYLKEHVRMNDLNGSRLLNLLDKKELTEVEAAKIAQISSDNCNFLESWHQLPSDSPTLKVVPTKMAKNLVVDQTNAIIAKKIPNTIFTATDEVSRRGQNLWTKTLDNNVATLLNKNCLEPEALFLFRGAPMRMTRNDAELQLCHGQLCVVNIVPTSEGSHVDLFVAPPCIRELPPKDTNGHRYFQANGWRVVKVRRTESLPHLYKKHFPFAVFNFPSNHSNHQLSINASVMILPN